MPTRKTATAQDPEVVGQDEHLELTRSLQGGITEFFAGAGKFFKTASEIRERIDLVLVRAEALKVPTTDTEAKVIQRVVLDSNAVKKENAEHWDPVASALNKLHKLITAGRGDVENKAKRAASLGNRLHSDYLAEKERKARLEQQRIDRIARENAQRERDEEERRLEEERLKVEADSPNLSDREQRFVTAYDRIGVTSGAEREAGYKPGYGDKLLATIKIQTALELLRKAREIVRQQEVVRSSPVIPKATPAVRPTMSYTVGAGSRKQRGAEVYDEAALIEAILAQAANPPSEGNPIIPTDILKVHHPRVNDYARSLGRSINEWPGVRFTEESKVTGS